MPRILLSTACLALLAGCTSVTASGPDSVSVLYDAILHDRATVQAVANEQCALHGRRAVLASETGNVLFRPTRHFDCVAP